MKKLLLIATLCSLALPAIAADANPLVKELLGATSQADGLEVRRPLVAWALLEQCGRLLPDDCPAEKIEELAAALAQGADPAGLEKLPPADDLVLMDGRLQGGNFKFFDYLVGIDHRPLALDRNLPVVVVPLGKDATDTMEKRKFEFQTSAETGLIRAREDRFHMQKVSKMFVADGLAMRPYAGRADDWYYRLVQEGTPYTQLQFYAMIEGWPDRAYHPLTGMGASESAPPVWFNTSDLLSHHALSAVRTAIAAGADLKRNPFEGLALRVLPYCEREFSQLETGVELGVPPNALAQARTRGSRLAPPTVSPIFHDPSRFLGMLERNEWIQARNPLPSSSVPALEPELPMRSPTLEEASAVTYWEDPKAVVIPPVPGEMPGGASRAPAAGPGPATASTPGAAAPAATPPPAPAPSQATYRVAVLLPKIDEAETYVQTIAANEASLTENAASLQRATHVAQWIGQLMPALPATVSEDLRARCQAVQGQYTAGAEQLRAERFDLFCARSAARRALEHDLRDKRLPELISSLNATKSL